MTAAPIPALLILSFASLRLMQTFCTDTVLGCALLGGVRRDILMERDPPRPPHADRRENPLRKLSRSGCLSCPREMLALPRHPLLCSRGSRLLGRSRGLSGGTAHGGPTPGLAPLPRAHLCSAERPLWAAVTPFHVPRANPSPLHPVQCIWGWVCCILCRGPSPDVRAQEQM